MVRAPCSSHAWASEEEEARIRAEAFQRGREAEEHLNADYSAYEAWCREIEEEFGEPLEPTVEMVVNHYRED